MDMQLAATGYILTDGHVSLSLREKFVTFADTIFDREIFREILRQACSDEERGFEIEDIHSEVLGELTDIEAGLATAYDTAVTSAITAMLFRIGKAGWILDDHLAKVAMDKQKRNIFFQAVQRGKDRLTTISSTPAIAAVA